MAGQEFDKERIDRYYRQRDSQDHSYVESVFRDPGNEQALRKLMSGQFSEQKAPDSAEQKDLDPILYRIHYDINTRLAPAKRTGFKTGLIWASRIASVMLLPLFIYLGIKQYMSNPEPGDTWVEISAPAWTRAQFLLPDGTAGWLNSSSSIKYQGDFMANRRVEITGEAYFDVASVKNRPFTVCTSELDLKVLGTRFNIASYQNEESVEVVLEEGSIGYTNSVCGGTGVLAPDEMLVLEKSTGKQKIHVVQPHKYISWTMGKLVFRNDPLDVIARRLERWYNIDVILNIQSPEDMLWRATFVDDNLEVVLNMMKRSLNIQYAIEYADVQADDQVSKTKVTLSMKRGKPKQ